MNLGTRPPGLSAFPAPGPSSGPVAKKAPAPASVASQGKQLEAIPKEAKPAVSDGFVKSEGSTQSTLIPRPKVQSSSASEESKKSGKAGKFLKGLATVAGFAGLAAVSVPAAVGAAIGTGVGAMLDGAESLVSGKKSNAKLVGGIAGAAIGGVLGTTGVIAAGTLAAVGAAVPVLAVGGIAIAAVTAFSK